MLSDDEANEDGPSIKSSPRRKRDVTIANSGRKIKRQCTLLEKEALFTHINSDRSAKQNMKSFIDNFGIRFELPSMYVIDAQFYPNNCVYSL